MSHIKIKQAFEAKAFEPTIRHIRFPHFKNLTPYLKLEFFHPITALVGANGSNKSSVLRALACCPQQQSIGEHWFSTEVDPIDEGGGRPRYIYGYIDPATGNTVEVIQSRISKPNNPDYWEPSRPIISDYMDKMPPIKSGAQLKGRSKTRWAGIVKKVEILDFRSEISAFDKLFYHGEMTGALRHKTPKDQLRARSKLLKRVIDSNLQSLRPFKSRQENIFYNNTLPTDQVDAISTILGKNYDKIRVIRHKLFESDSYTAIMESAGLSYSEAFAGSGEFAIVMLVHKIMSLPSRSLIILDEPEVSLHPGAQQKLMEFLLYQCLINKHQIFIGTHSQHIIESLPAEAIILLQPDHNTSKIVAEQNIQPGEAFFHMGLIPKAKKKIFVEDLLAKEIVLKCLRTLGSGALSQFEVVAYPGGAKSIFKKCITALLQANSEDCYFFLDGDQAPSSQIRHPDSIPESETATIKAELFALTHVKDLDFSLDGGNDPSLPKKKEALERAYLAYALARTYYLPGVNPEKFLWDHMIHDSAAKKCDNTDLKCAFEQLTRIEKGKIDYESVSSTEILETQIRRLAAISVEHSDLSSVSMQLKTLVE